MSKTVSITVDVDLSEFEDNDLLCELQDRGVLSNFEDELTEMFYAFKLRNQDRAMEIAKRIASDHVGMIL